MGRRAKPAKAKAKRPLARKSRGNDGSSRHELEKRLAEALEQQAATSEILRIIGTSPTDAQPIFDGIARSGVRLCGALGCAVFVVHGDMLHVAATHGIPPGRVARFRSQFPASLVAGPGSDGRSEVDAPRAVLERRIFHLADIENNPEASPEQVEMAQLGGYRTRLMVPMMRGDKALGLIAITSRAATPFTDQQVALLQTFADQAVIAIENVRLFTELQEKNLALTQAHAQVTEALDQQTATSEILRVISRSPTDVRPVFDTIARNARRLCEADSCSVFTYGGDLIRLESIDNATIEGADAIRRAYPLPPSRGHASGRAILTSRPVHIPDVRHDPEYDLHGILGAGLRSIVAVPMLRDGIAIGTITLHTWATPRPFSATEIALLQTFADQAVIAIENVRLFKELEARNRQLTEALDQQTATADILRVISSSPTDLVPVMETLVESAARLCEAQNAQIFRLEDDQMRLVARHGPVRSSLEVGQARPITRGSVSGRAILDRTTIHLPDLLAEVESEYPDIAPAIQREGIRATIGVPLLREGSPIGSITAFRTEARPFSDKQIALLKTFADQAVIAIENVRLFNELQARTRELTQSVEQLTALGEVSRAVSSTLEVETVLNTIVSRASQLAGAACSIYVYDDVAERFELRATHNYDAEFVEAVRAIPLGRAEGLMGRAAETREPAQIPDITRPGAYESSRRDVLIRFGYRALLSVPLLREDQVIGSLSFNRKAPGAFPPEVIDVLKNFATQSGLAIENARLFREIEEKSRQLEAASRHKSEFLANMSHELRTPLNAIIGFSEVLAERMFGEVNEKQAEYLQDILASGRHLLSLINDILDLSKVEAGRLALELGSFNLPVAVENALTLIRERATRHGISLTQAMDGRVGDIVADERKVKQILLNLLSNAVKFTPAGGRVTVTATPSDGVIEISVSDTGIGIAPEDQTAIFEAFRQAGKSDAQRPEGTGLGLTLAKKFVELHGGQIWVRSQVGQGSTFTFTLPVRPESMSSSE